MAKVTLQDVAKAAGVSIATASWAVNDNRNVRIPESTRRKVRKAADSLGYHHNALARGLARGCSDIIGFISDGVATSPFAGQVIQGAQDEAWRNGKILLVVNTNGKKDVERKTFAFMLEHQVEGVIYSKWVHESITPPSELDKVPAVLVNVADFLLWCRMKFRVGPQPRDYCLRPDIGVSRSLTPLRPRLRRLADLKDTKRRLRHSASILIRHWWYLRTLTRKVDTGQRKR